MIKANYIYAEDGGVFTDGFQKMGMNSIFEPFAGYLVVASRLFAMVSISLGRLFNDFNVVPLCMKLLSALFVATIIAYFASDRFEFFIKTRLKRFIVATLLLLTMFQFTGLMLCSVSIHWWCGLFMFLIGLEVIHGQIPKKRMLPLIVISILSSPSGLVIAFGLLYFIVNKFVKKEAKTILEKETLIFLIVVVISLLVQARFILFKTDVSTITNGPSTRHLIDTIGNTYEVALGSPLFVFTKRMFTAFYSIGAGHIVGAILWVVALAFGLKQKKVQYVLYALICNFFLYVMMFYKIGETPEAKEYLFTQLTDSWHDIFYNAMPAAIVFLIFASLYMEYSKKQHLAVNLAILALLTTQLVTYRWKPQSSINWELNAANEDLDFNSDKYAIIKTAPYEEYKWFDFVHVPVKAEYCEKEGIICESIND